MCKYQGSGIIVCIILNYNDAETTLKLLNHILSFSIFKHIIIVDNKSTDDSWEKLQSLKNKKICLLQAPINGGYGYGNNLGINYAYNTLKAEYALIANPDTIFEEGCIVKLVNGMRKFNDAGIISCKQANSLDWGWKDVSIIKYILSTSLFFEVWLKIRCYPQKYFKDKTIVKVFSVPGSLLLIDIAKMLEIGLYDTDIFLYYEEPILGQKFAEKGYQTYLMLDTAYIHLHNVSTMKVFRHWTRQHKVQLKSCITFLKKYKHADAGQIFIAHLFFIYTYLEFFIYDIFRIITSKKSKHSIS